MDTEQQNERYEEALDVIQEDGREILTLKARIKEMEAELNEWKEGWDAQALEIKELEAENADLKLAASYANYD